MTAGFRNIHQGLDTFLLGFYGLLGGLLCCLGVCCLLKATPLLLRGLRPPWLFASFLSLLLLSSAALPYLIFWTFFCGLPCFFFFLFFFLFFFFFFFFSIGEIISPINLRRLLNILSDHACRPCKCSQKDKTGIALPKVARFLRRTRYISSSRAFLRGGKLLTSVWTSSGCGLLTGLASLLLGPSLVALPPYQVPMPVPLSLLPTPIPLLAW